MLSRANDFNMRTKTIREFYKGKIRFTKDAREGFSNMFRVVLPKLASPTLIGSISGIEQLMPQKLRKPMIHAGQHCVGKGVNVHKLLRTDIGPWLVGRQILDYRVHEFIVGAMYAFGSIVLNLAAKHAKTKTINVEDVEFAVDQFWED